MSIKELYDIIEKFDTKELWVDPSVIEGGRMVQREPNASIVAQREVVVAALNQVEKLITGKGEES